MDQTSEIQKALVELLKGTEIAENLSAEQNRQLLSDLELGIIVEMSAELLGNLSDEGKKLLEEEHFQGYGALLAFLKKTSAPEAYQTAMAKAVDGVLEEFLHKTFA